VIILVFDKIIAIFEKFESEHKNETYKYLEEIFLEVRPYYNDYIKREFPDKNVNQKWRNDKGRYFEQLIIYIIKKEIKNLDVKVIHESELSKKEHEMLKRNLLVDFGKYGCYLPDADLILYLPDDSSILGIISSKTSLRERFTQTVYWKMKLKNNENTKHIKVFLFTMDNMLNYKNEKIKEIKKTKKRAILETELDGSYILNRNVIEGDTIKSFASFINDLKKILNND